MQFLCGLNYQYSNVRSHVLLMDPLPPISKIFSYVAQQEHQLLGNVTYDTKETLINVVNNSYCTHYGRAGHTEVVCYRKHGFSSNTDNKSGKSITNRGGKICTHCGRTGHTVEVCYRKHGFPSRHKFYNNKNNVVNNIVIGHGRVMENDPQQFQALSLIQQPNNGTSTSSTSCVNQIGLMSSSITVGTYGNSLICSATNSLVPWILDSGATDHVSSSLHNFSSYISISPIVVKLPNGQQVATTHFGVVKFSESLFLVDVLYIPNFNFNLIYVSKLASSLKCELIFSHSSCINQGSKTRRKIGTIDVHDGLYTLVLQPVVNHFIQSVIVHPQCNKLPIDLWHFRLGHPSHQCMRIMKQCYPCLSSDSTFICNTCHFAKQRKLPFPLSHSHAFKPFELLHMDIWGPCSTTSMNGHRYFLTIVDDNT